MKVFYKQEEHLTNFLVSYASQLGGTLLLKKLKYFEVM